ncbi:DUF4331 family protein [Ekhidna sp.]|uniref:DUF4331 family protein n=1 Tax=Ekhidna sp. TaxID=2608089 RepID=UPI003B506CA9
MKKIVYLLVGVTTLTFGVIFLRGADHVDAPAVGSLSSGSSVADIADLFAFESPSNSQNYVFIGTVNGLLAPSATSDAQFDEEVMYEFNIDNDGDLVEDQVIQVYFENGNAITYGVVTPSQTGLSSILEKDGVEVKVEVTPHGQNAKIGSNDGTKLFAGATDDPFYFDLFQFRSIVNGLGAALSDENNTGVYSGDRLNSDTNEPYPAAFNNPGQDALAGTNVLSFVVEVPKSMLSTSSTFNVWLESKMVQQ